MPATPASPGEAPVSPRRFLIVASDFGGGDVQPLLAIAAGLVARGHRVVAFGDADISLQMAQLGVETTVAAPELSLGALYAAAAREDGQLPPEVRGERMRDRLFPWAERLAPSLENTISQQRPDALIGSLFTCGPIRLAAERRGLRWAGVNSTFYLGPDPPAPLGTRLRPPRRAGVPRLLLAEPQPSVVGAARHRP